VCSATQNRKAVYVGKTQKNLVHRLKQLRKIHHVTQEEFSERTGISYKYYQAIETGVKKELRISTLERLASAYGIDVWELLGPEVPNSKLTQKAKRG
jgi:transcriptional regulator with XRE-family HTH domain